MYRLDIITGARFASPHRDWQHKHGEQVNHVAANSEHVHVGFGFIPFFEIDNSFSQESRVDVDRVNDSRRRKCRIKPSIARWPTTTTYQYRR